MANYLIGEARFTEGRLDELAVFPLDPDPELEAAGHMQMTYVVGVDEVINSIKKGNSYVASFRDAKATYPIAVIVRDGKETLEVADVGQAAEFRTLRNLPDGS